LRGGVLTFALTPGAKATLLHDSFTPFTGTVLARGGVVLVTG